MRTVLIGLSIAIVAGALGSLWLDQRRTVAPNDAAHRAKRHAAFTAAAALAWLVGGLIAAWSVAEFGALGGRGRIVAVLPATAGALFIATHAVGELTWPGPRGRQREADLEVRTAGDVTPTGLLRWTWTVAALMLVGIASYGFLATGPRTIRRVLEDGHFYTVNFPGWWFGVPVLVAAVVVGVACAGTLRVIAARPAVAGASSDWDRWLRRRSARQVLRGSQLVGCLTLAGLSLIAGGSLRTLGEWYLAGQVSTGYLVAGTSIRVFGIAVAAAGLVAAVVPARDPAPEFEALAPAVEAVGS